MTNEEFIRTCSKDELIKDMQGKINTCWSCGNRMAKGERCLCGDRCMADDENLKKWLEMEHWEISEESDGKCES